MKTFFKEALDYHNYFNQKLLVEIKSHLSELPDNSFPLFCHVLNAHQIWNARILNSSAFGVNEVHEFDACFELEIDNYLTSLKIIETEDFERIVVYRNSQGQEFSNKISDILFHIINHSTHHKAQLLSHFSQVGIKPIVLDYIFYKR